MEQLLDDILQFLIDNDDWASPRNLPILFNSFALSEDHFFELLNILKEDGYIRIEENEDEYNPVQPFDGAPLSLWEPNSKLEYHYVYLTIKGKIKIQTSGYVGEREYKHRLQKRVDDIAAQNLLMTKILAAAASVASIYYLSELWDKHKILFFHWLCGCH